MSRLARISIVTLSVVIFLYVGLGYVLGKTSDDNPTARSACSAKSCSTSRKTTSTTEHDSGDCRGIARTAGIPRPPIRISERSRVRRLP